MRLWWAWRVVALVLSVQTLAYTQSLHGIARHPAQGDTRIPYASLPPDPAHLLDLELSNVVLTTSVDGSLTGVDRTSGRVLWELSARTSYIPGLVEPLVASHYGAEHRTLEELAAHAFQRGDPATLQALESSGIYIVEPSSGGDLYVLRTRTEHGEPRPHLEKMPFSLPELVTLSPFSLSSDDTRVFVAERYTRLVELNVFTGTVGAVFDAKDAYAYDVPQTAAYGSARPDDKSDYDAIESPWVYVGRTDYVLTVHVRNAPHTAQTLRYSVYAPNSADQEMAALWAQHTEQVDKRGILVSPSDNALLCFDLRDAKSTTRHRTTSMPPVLWTCKLNASVVDVFDVIFVPPATSSADTPLLRPMIVPHTPGVLAEMVERQQRRSVSNQLPSAYLGMSPGGSLFALGRSRYPLVELVAPAAATTGQRLSEGTMLQPWLGGYDVPNAPHTQAVPLLDGPFRDYKPLLGTPPNAEHSRPWLEAPGLLAMRLLGLALLLLVVVRGYTQIRKDRSPLILNTESLRFENEEQAKRMHAQEQAKRERMARESHPYDVPLTSQTSEGAPSTSVAEHTADASSRPPAQPASPVTHAAERVEEAGDGSPATPAEDDSRRRRRRRGKRAGAAVLARQSPAPRREESVEPRTSALTTPAGAEIPPSSLQISDEVLGYGSSGTVVFRGTFQGRAVAVKRLLRDFVLMASKEVSLLQSADNHPNVIRYFCQELTPNFLYIALEQCPASLADLIERPLEHGDLAPLLDPRNAFKQITAGLQHLHSLSIVHRDIKPQNILVTRGAQNRLRMLLSDFGLSKRMDGIAQSSFSQSVNQPGGTVGWRAPEVLQGHRSLMPSSESEESARLTRAVDIFSLGCVAFYMLSGGAHPFGSQYEREMHIVQGRFDVGALHETCDDTVEAQALIQSMIAHDAAKRPSADRVAQHPFFWNAQRRLSFLQDVSDRFETLEREPPSLPLQVLEKHASSVIGTDWRRRFDRAFLDDLGRFRKYDPASIQDLLRVIRNKKHHFQDMQPQLKKQLSPMPDGFLLFFTRRFPALFLHVYQAMDQLPLLRSEAVFSSYYQTEDV